MPDLRPRPSLVISKTINRALTRGAREVINLGFQRVRQGIWSSDTLVFLTREADRLALPDSQLVFRRATDRDAKRYALFIGTDSPTTFVARLSPTTRCYLVEHEDVVLHASWVTTSAAWTRELRRYVVPPKRDAYVYESFTRSDARGLGVYPFALLNITNQAAGQSLRKVWVAAEEDNPPSLRAIAKAGFHEAFRLPYYRRFGVLRIGAARGDDAATAMELLSGTPERRALQG